MSCGGPQGYKNIIDVSSEINILYGLEVVLMMYLIQYDIWNKSHLVYSNCLNSGRLSRHQLTLEIQTLCNLLIPCTMSAHIKHSCFLSRHKEYL